VPFKSEAQRRYLWANEPEIARDWTDTYGSRIQKRMGGIMGSNAGSMLVTPTRDGSRPGYYGPDAGHENDPHGSNSNNGGDNNGGDNRENYISRQYTNVPTPTVTVGVDKFDNPIEIKTTYTDKRNRQKTLDALNAKGISSFDPRVTKRGFNLLDPNNLITNFAPKQKQFGLLDLALIAASGGLLGPKIAAGAKMYNTGKFAYNKAKQIGGLLETIGLTDKNVVDSFTSNLTENFGKGKKSTKNTTTKNNTTNNGGKGDGEGIASLQNQAGNYDEYILLLQKLQTGNITEAERNRFNVLKNMLGI